MNTKREIAALCAAAALFSGCGNNSDPDANSFDNSEVYMSSSSSSSTVESSTSSSSSSSSTSSSVETSSSSVAESSSSSSSTPASSTASSSSVASSKPVSSTVEIRPTEIPDIPPENVSEINENTVVAENDEIRIEKDSALRLNSEMELNGDLYVEGKLFIEESAKISGTGTIHVVNSFDDIICIGTVTAKIDAPEPVEIDGVTYVGGVLVANKKYSLPKDFGSGLSKDLNAAVKAMRADSGFKMPIISGFRSYELQERVFASWCAKDGEEVARTYSAVPGHSEHQTGLAADITSCMASYANTAEAKWLAENCYKYGCIIRYPADKVAITGYIYEPWHIRYLGKSTAKLVHDSGLCLEEFLEIDG